MPTTISGTDGCSQVPAGSIQFDDVSAGMVIQVANYTTGAVATGTTIIPLDDTIPQITEGTQFMSLAFTPKKANSLLRIEVIVNGNSQIASGYYGVALFRDTTANALATSLTYDATANSLQCIPLSCVVSAGAITPTTFYVRAGLNSAGTFTFNGIASARQYGGSLASSITITEIAQ